MWVLDGVLIKVYGVGVVGNVIVLFVDKSIVVSGFFISGGLIVVVIFVIIVVVVFGFSIMEFSGGEQVLFGGVLMMLSVGILGIVLGMGLVFQGVDGR